MATRMKRCSYDSDTESSSYEDGDADIGYKCGKTLIKSDGNLDYHHRKSKCSSRNAILARENRIKKKLYMQKVEQEVRILRKDNVELNVIIENQSYKIAELQKCIKYMKSALANSADLRVLMKNIQSNTGMSVTSSLDKTLTLNNDCVAKCETRIARKTPHPWNDEESRPVEECKNDVMLNSFPEVDGFIEEPFPDLLFDLDTLDYNSDNHITMQTLDNGGVHNEHNYTLTSKLLNDEDTAMDDVGVCLHVSKHHVSLEFCSSCSENASETWKNVE